MAQTAQNPQGVQNPSTQTAGSPVSEQKKQGFPKLLFALGLIFLLAFVLVFLFVRGERKAENVNDKSEASAVPEASNPPNPVLAEYINGGYGFKFKYNEIWELAETTSEPVMGSVAALGFTFKNTLPGATGEAVPNLPKLIVYVFTKNPSLDNFIRNLPGGAEVTVADCPGGIKQCKTLQSKDPARPFGIQVVRQGANNTFGFLMLDENVQPASLDRIPQPLGAVINNFSGF